MKSALSYSLWKKSLQPSFLASLGRSLSGGSDSRPTSTASYPGAMPPPAAYPGAMPPPTMVPPMGVVPQPSASSDPPMSAI